MPCSPPSAAPAPPAVASPVHPQTACELSFNTSSPAGPLGSHPRHPLPTPPSSLSASAHSPCGTYPTPRESFCDCLALLPDLGDTEVHTSSPSLTTQEMFKGLNYFHFKDEDTEAQRSHVSCSGVHLKAPGQDSDPGRCDCRYHTCDFQTSHQ